MSNTLDVALIMGSDSDYPQLESAVKLFREFGLNFEVRVISAHRTPDRLHAYIKDAEARGVGLFIGAAGGAAHLPGVIASQPALPVMGIPLRTTAFSGEDSLLSILQMPAGIPVATMPVGSAGPKNAALFAVQVLSLRQPELLEKMKAFRQKQAEGVAKKDEALAKKIAEEN